MDEDEEYSENRDEQLERFRNSLKLPLAERFFSEDELIDIFDYAGDLNDDFLRIEALLCGARFHPESEELLVRRGIFFSQYSDEARAQFLNYNKTTGNLILEILRLRNSSPMDDDTAKERLDALIANCNDIPDEEIIQLVDVASSIGQYEWLKENLDVLRQKAGFLNILLFETSVVAELHHDYEFAAKLLEELTELEPFNSYYWQLLSRQYTEMEDGQKALSAIDYALAINPQSYPAMLYKARLMYMLDHPLDEVLTLLRTAIMISNNDVDGVKFLAQIYHNEEQDDMACQVILDALSEAEKKDNENEDMEPELSERKLIFEYIPDLILYRPDNLPELLDQFYAANDENSQLMWMSWAQQLSVQGHNDLAKAVIECYERNSGEDVPTIFGIEDAFIKQDYQATIDAIQKYLQNINGSETDFPSILTMHILSLVKTQQEDRALALCDFVTSNVFLTGYTSVGNRLEYLGMLKIVKEIKSHIKKHVSEDFWSTYDPLCLLDNK